MDRITRTGKIVAFGIMALMILPIFGAGAGEVFSRSELRYSSEKEIIDDFGRVVIIPETVERIISVSPSATEVLFALGLGDRVVGVSDWCDYPPEISTKVKDGVIKRVGGYSTPKIEKIVSLEPDVVFISGIAGEEIVKTLENVGLAVFALKESQSISGIWDHISIMGKIAGVEEKAEELISEMRDKINEITEKVSGEEKASIAAIVYPDPLWIVGLNTFTDEMIRIAGGSNVFSDKKGFSQVTHEKLISKDPDVLVVFEGHGSEGNMLDFIMNDERFKDLTAVKNERVYGIDENLLARDGPRVAEGIEALYGCMHLYNKNEELQVTCQIV